MGVQFEETIIVGNYLKIDFKQILKKFLSNLKFR